MMKKTLGILTVVLTAIVLLGFGFIAIRGLLGPGPGSARFGMQVTDAAGALFYRVYLSRNLVIVVTGLTFLVLRKWRAMAILTTATLILPAFDIWVLNNEFGDAAPLTFHIATLAVVSLLAGLWWRKALQT